MTDIEKMLVYDSHRSWSIRLKLALDWIDELRSTVACLEFGKATGVPLRDWFAGQALAGLTVDMQQDEVFAGVAALSYMYADAMLAERKRQQGPSA